MRRSLVPWFACVLAAASVCAAAQRKKPTAQKPKPKVTAPVPRLGTQQMSGNDAVFGTEYTCGKSMPMNVIIKSLEYRGDRVRTGESFTQPDKEQKLLYVSLAYHNPRPQESL